MPRSGAEARRPAARGGHRALPRARLRRDDDRADRGTRRRHGTHLFPPLPRQARGAVRRRDRIARHHGRRHRRRPDATGPLELVIGAYTAAVPLFVTGRPVAERRARIMAGIPALEERAHAKSAALQHAVIDALAARGIPEPTARLAAQVGAAAFSRALGQWYVDPGARPRRASRESDRRGTRALELRDLVERELDRRLALEERDEHGELAALGLDLADRAGQARERALLDGDGLADLEVDLGRDDARRGLAAALAARRPWPGASTICTRLFSMLKASSKRSGVGLWELPTNPVTPGVWRTTDQLSSLRSMRTST